MKHLKLFIIAPLIFSQLQNKPSTQPIIELDTLRIEGTIYEPQVLYILEEPSLKLITNEEKQKHNFLEDFDQPLHDLLY